jgi:hypothetical protein
MPSINGAAGYLQHATDSPGANRWSAPAPFDPGSANPIARGPATANPLLFTAGWSNAPAPNPPVVNRMPRNPFVLNQLLVNPLIGNRLADPLNGPILLAGGWGVPFIPARRENNPLAEARRPGSLLDQTPEFSPHSVAMTVYQPVSGIITLADGSTFYRGAGTSFANELGNSSAGGGLDSSRIGGNFFSPDLGTVGTLGQNAFLPYVW